MSKNCCFVHKRRNISSDTLSDYHFHQDLSENGSKDNLVASVNELNYFQSVFTAT